MDVLPPVRDLGHLLPLRGRLDGRHPRVRRSGREADRGDLREARHHPRPAGHPRRPRLLETSRPVALLLADLGVTQSHSRPHVSNDNPYSEAQFKTLKYRPAFPARFASIQAARAHCQNSSPGTTTSIITAGPACTPPPTCTTAAQRPSRPPAPRPWTLPATLTPGASSANRQPRRNCQAHPGSTRRPKTRRPTLSKTRVIVPHSG
jgi:hypothetical protein